MVHTYFIGRIGQDAKVITGERGMFVSMDIAVENFVKGERTTTWVRVRSKKQNHINLSKYLTKGKLLCCQGSLNEPTIWTDKDGVQHVQLSISADTIDFVSTGKKKSEDTLPQGQEAMVQDIDGGRTDSVPFDAPQDKSEDLPF